MGFKILVRSAPSLFLDTLKAAFEDQPYVLLAPGNSELNWADDKAVEVYIKKKAPSIVVNYSLLPLLGKSAELKSLTNLVAQCDKLRAPIIHISSYRVFGEQPVDVDLMETYTPEPDKFDDYAQYLLALENICRNESRHIIVRLSWMLNGEVDNIIDRIVPALLNGQAKSLVVSDHAFGNPIHVHIAVHVVFAMIQQILCGADNWGAFHVHSSDTCSEAEFCDNLVRLLKAELKTDIPLPQIASADDDRKLMPGNANIQGRRCTDNFGIQLTSWRKGLKALLKLYLEKNQPVEVEE